MWNSAVASVKELIVLSWSLNIKCQGTTLFSFYYPLVAKGWEMRGFCMENSVKVWAIHLFQTSAYWQLFGQCWLWCPSPQGSSCLTEGQTWLDGFWPLTGPCVNPIQCWFFSPDASGRAHRSKLDYKDTVEKAKKRVLSNGSSTPENCIIRGTLLSLRNCVGVKCG